MAVYVLLWTRKSPSVLMRFLTPIKRRNILSSVRRYMKMEPSRWDSPIEVWMSSCSRFVCSFFIMSQNRDGETRCHVAVWTVRTMLQITRKNRKRMNAQALRVRQRKQERKRGRGQKMGSAFWCCQTYKKFPSGWLRFKFSLLPAQKALIKNRFQSVFLLTLSFSFAIGPYDGQVNCLHSLRFAQGPVSLFTANQQQHQQHTCKHAHTHAHVPTYTQQLVYAFWKQKNP